MPLFERILQLPLWLFSLLAFLILIGAREAGVWVQRRTTRWRAARDAPDREFSHEDFVLSSVLLLLALLIAFTFSMALDRYDTRRGTLLAEANAIGTAYQRVQLLDEGPRAELSSQLRDYARLRLRYGEAEAAAKPPLQQESNRRQRALSAAAIEAVRPIRTTDFGGAVMQSVNTLLETGAARHGWHSARLPRPILAILLLYTFISAAVVGYVHPDVGARDRVTAALMFALLTLALSTVIDLDDSQRGAIRIDQQPMRELVANLEHGTVKAGRREPPDS
jgi:multidrug efflux pump subunit AcrA (membrane-fusion protein)